MSFPQGGLRAHVCGRRLIDVTMLRCIMFLYAGEHTHISAVVEPRDRLARWLPVCFVLLPLLGLAVARPCLAAENSFDLIPKWVRPGPDTSVSVKFTDGIGEIKKNKGFLRLTLPRHVVKDMPLDNEQMGRGLAEVKIPGPMRRGTYKTELVSEGGKVVARGPEDFKVRASEKPSIASILPSVCYPTDRGFDFEIIGDDFSQYQAKELEVRMNDVPIRFKKRMDDRKGDMSADQCGGDWPCLIWNWRTLRIFGLSLSSDNQSFHRPLKISVEGDDEFSDQKLLVLSRVKRNTPIAIASVVLGVLVALVYFICRRRVGHSWGNNRNYATLTYLLIDPQTNTYSLSKLQLILWTAAAIMAYSYLVVSQSLVQGNWVLPKVPEGLPMLLGLSATTTALAVGATEFRGSKGAGPVHPGLADFITTGGVFAPERLQFFLWTILGTIGFVAGTLAQDPGTVTRMAEIPESFNPLMGASSLGYLAGKFARKPGPVIKHMDPYPSATALPKEIRIDGENLSPRATVRLYGALLPADQLKPVPDPPPEGKEFVSTLIVTPKDVESAVPGAAAVKVTNPDGQSAQM